MRTADGTLLGLIFAELEMTATDVRDIIIQQLSEVLEDRDFIFLDRNGFPIAITQESLLRVWDLMKFGFITITRPRRCQLTIDITDCSLMVEETARKLEVEETETNTSVSPMPLDKDASDLSPCEPPSYDHNWSDHLKCQDKDRKVVSPSVFNNW